MNQLDKYTQPFLLDYVQGISNTKVAQAQWETNPVLYALYSVCYNKVVDWEYSKEGQYIMANTPGDEQEALRNRKTADWMHTLIHNSPF